MEAVAGAGGAEGGPHDLGGVIAVILVEWDLEFLRLLVLEGVGSGAVSLLNRSEAIP